MAVPIDGVLTLEGLAQEALYGTYGSGTITPPIHLYDLVNGGDSAGSGNSYPTVNEDCLPNPAYRVQGIQLSQTNMFPVGAYQSVYYNPNDVSDATELAVGDYVYNSILMTGYAAETPTGRYYFQYGDTLNPTDHHCGTNSNMNMTVDSDGKITSITCIFPEVTLEVVTIAIVGVIYPHVRDETVNNQVITYSWTFVGQSADEGGSYSTVSYDGLVRANGYETPAISGNINEVSWNPLSTFTVTEGNENTISFKYTLLTAAVDTVPTAPDNSVTITRGAPDCYLSTSVTPSSPTNVAGNNGTLEVDYDFLSGTIQYSTSGSTWITPTQTPTSGSFTVPNLSVGTATIFFRTLGVWPDCTRQNSYTIDNPFRISPTNVPSADPYISVLGTAGDISTQIKNILGQVVLTSTENPVYVGGLASGTYFVNVTQTNPSYSYPQVSIFVN